MKKNYLVYYHENCWDGVCAAFLAKKALEALPETDTVYICSVQYNRAPDESVIMDVTEIYFVDFAPPPAFITYLDTFYPHLKHIYIVDHHETAIKKYVGYDAPDKLNLFFSYDNSKSGTGLVASLFMNQELSSLDNMIPALIQDRDLWKFEFEETQYFSRYLSLFEPNVRIFEEQIWPIGFNSELMADAIETGRLLEVKYEKDLNYYLAKAVEISIDGHIGAAVNAPYELASDLGHRLAKKYQYGAVFQVDLVDQTIKFSLRSNKGGFNVAELAAKYGGGGHQPAAGFSISFHEEIANGLRGIFFPASNTTTAGDS